MTTIADIMDVPELNRLVNEHYISRVLSPDEVDDQERDATA